MMAEGSWMMQATDGGDDLAMLLQRLERTRKLVILPRRSDLVVQRMNTIGKVDEGATPGGGGQFLGPLQRDHAFQQRQRDTTP